MYDVWLLLLADFEPFDASAAIHAFSIANDVLRETGRCDVYRTRCFTADRQSTRRKLELAIEACALPDELAQPVRAVIVVGGGTGAAKALQMPSSHQLELSTWIARAHAHIASFTSIGADGFVVLQTALAMIPPGVPSGVRDVVMTSTGMDVALRLIAQDQGYPVALKVAMRLAPSPDPGQALSRFRSGLSGPTSGDERVIALNHWIAQNLRETLNVQRLADQALMSTRTFARLYRRATGYTPARAVERIRLEHACCAMESTLLSLKAIALRSGFSSEEVMRRAFMRVLGIAPSQYKRMFADRSPRA
jgi:transcriptional regulator GlxA family with amidase domain